jgi:chemotaxis protein MotB
VARRQIITQKDETKRYLETFSDLMSLLLVFFILMFALGQADLVRFRQLASSLRAAFSGVSVFEGGLGVSDGFDSTGMSEPNTHVVGLGALPSRQQDYLHISSTMTRLAMEKGVMDQVAVNIGKEGIYISLSSALLFPSGGASLNEDGRDTLDRIARLLNELPNNIRVEAHTDNTPTGTPLYPTNWELSGARATTVVRYLQEMGGVDAARLAAVGLGEYHPLYPNDTPEHRSLNRRADILILYPPEDEPKIIDLADLSKPAVRMR